MEKKEKEMPGSRQTGIKEAGKWDIQNFFKKVKILN